MEIIPAIDIIDGKCVRLTQGDFATQKTYYDDPLDAARRFEDAGVKRLHLVDLDGARTGSIQNLVVLQKLASSTDLLIDFGGGIKKIEDANSVFNAGASMIALGSIAVKRPMLVEEWIIEFGPEKIWVGADVLDEKIQIAGWQEDGDTDVFSFISQMLAVGVQQVFCTDISRDGNMKGPSLQLYQTIMARFPELQFTASGGVSKVGDLYALQEAGCAGAIVGKALYENNISLEQLSTFINNGSC